MKWQILRSVNIYMVEKMGTREPASLGVCCTRCCRCRDACNRRVTHLLNIEVIHEVPVKLIYKIRPKSDVSIELHMII